MTEHKENELLRDILLDAAAEEFVPEFSSTEQVETSLKFQKSMQSLLTDPKKWAERRQRPVWKRAAKMVATLLLICILSFGILMFISPKAYAAVVNWIAEWYDTHISYLFTGETEETVLRNYEITHFPEGYNPHGQLVIQPDKFSNTTAIIYSDSDCHELYFEYFPMEKNIAKITHLDSAVVTNITVNGHTGQLYVYDNEKESNMIVWMDENSNMCFSIDAFLDGDELLRVAESVVEVVG